MPEIVIRLLATLAIVCNMSLAQVLPEPMPNEGADQLLENMYVSAMQTMRILDEADKEKEA